MMGFDNLKTIFFIKKTILMANRRLLKITSLLLDHFSKTTEMIQIQDNNNHRMLRR